MNKKNPHWGTTLNDFLSEEIILEATKAEAAARVMAWQPTQEMQRQGGEGEEGGGASINHPRHHSKAL